MRAATHSLSSLHAACEEIVVTDEERRSYDDWLERRRPLLDAKQWTDAMRDVPATD